MKPQDYKTIRDTRWAEAQAHEQEMIAKYSALGKEAENIATWWEWHEELPSGLKMRHLRREYPKPYSNLYFRRFLTLILKCPLSDIKYNLSSEFVGDEIDKDYVNGMLLEAETAFGLGSDNVLLTSDQNGDASYNLTSGDSGSFSKAATADQYYGGEEFRIRAEIVRTWLQGKEEIAVRQPPKTKSREVATVSSRVPIDVVIAPTPKSAIAPPSPWEPLLIGALKLDGFFKFLVDCDLLTPTSEPALKGGLVTFELTTLGRGKEKAPWVGALKALITRDLLDTNIAAVCRALANPAGQVEVSMNEGTLRLPSNKSNTYIKTMLAKLDNYLNKSPLHK